MSGDGHQSWKALRAVDRFRLQHGTARAVAFAFIGVFAIPLIGIVLLLFGQVWFALPFLIVGGLLGTVGPFVAAAIAAFVYIKRFNAPARVAAQQAAGAPLASVAPEPSAPPPPDPVRDALLVSLDSHRQDGLAAANADVRKLFVFALGGIALALVLNVLVFDGEATIHIMIGAAILCLVGYVQIQDRRQRAYATTFKDAMFAGLSARYGQFERVVEGVPGLDRETRLGLVPHHVKVKVGDRFLGRYGEAIVEIAEISVQTRRKNGQRGKDSTVSSGSMLMVRLTLSRPLAATTVALAANLPRQAPRQAGLARVQLEDPEFEEIYEVFGSDQIGSRAVLTPAVMQRMMEMADHTDLMPPSLMADGTTMTVILRNITGKNWFEPGALSNADMAAHLKLLEDDLASAFALVETLVEMDRQLPAHRPATAPFGDL